VTARLLLAYDGTDFAGWATQPGSRSVQETVEGALAKLLPEPVKLTVAGRTDAGVHARGQVCSHSGPPAPRGALNAHLPHDVRVLASDQAASGFDARRDARSRTYRYRIATGEVESPFERGRALHWPHPLDRAVLDRCAVAAAGAHDFTAFTPTRTRHTRFERRVLLSEWREEPDGVLAYWIEADSFMRHMVRSLVGSMLAVARGRISEAAFVALLAGRPREEAGDTVAAHGLWLERVSY
jgi:tRNA pseudouridine38-40 synthase